MTVKAHVLLPLCLAVLCAAGCAPGAQPRPGAGDAGGAPVAAQPGAAAPAAAEVDVDLTALSATMVYAEVYNIMANPDDYVGKTIKMSGPYYASYYEGTGQYYHYVVVEDAAACCAQGLEFILSGGSTYPDDYPGDSARIEVAGVYDSYDEGGVAYYYLSAQHITVLD